MQMCKLCTYIIIVKIINNAKFHLINVYKHEMDLKLYALTFKVGKWIIRTFFFIFIEIQFDYKFKYIA
jgi:hypothetical protein